MALSLTVCTRGFGARVTAGTFDFARLRPRIIWVTPRAKLAGRLRSLECTNPAGVAWRGMGRLTGPSLNSKERIIDQAGLNAE